MSLDPVPPFRSLLIANRGEVAVRIARACAELGIRSVALYSDADRGALHTRVADEAHRLGPGPAQESYLLSERILEIARATGAEAVHPGYGFLAEDAAFAAACQAVGLAWVGPSPDAMALAGDKAAARRLAAQHGVPIVPGYDGSDQRDETLTAEAHQLGYPLLVKAAAGGGGRGMRVVRDEDSLVDALASARREALAAFGQDDLILERLVEHARHVEVQVLGDQHGHLIHLGERDCSVQRRHQKVIEESPAPGLSAELRTALGEAALTIARAAGYWNAGTCEFLVGLDDRFWFIEMNARLQVEHPVTELVTGIDLVRHQIEIAAGRTLDLRQDDIRLRGHAIECRLYGEDPFRDFLPSTGRIARLRVPQGPGLRHDLGYGDGDTLPPFYDTMLGKLIAYGEDRAAAIARARTALDGYVIDGLATNRDLLAWVLEHPTFRAGTATTDFLGDAWRPGRPLSAPAPTVAAAAARLLANSPHWAIAGQGIRLFLANDADRAAPPVAVRADRQGPAVWLLTVGDVKFRADVDDDRVSIRDAGSDVHPTAYVVAYESDALVVRVDTSRYRLRQAPPPSVDDIQTRAESGHDAALEAPMPARVVRVMVRPGDTVEERQPLVALEAMKIEHVIAAPRAGVVGTVRCAVGDAVQAGQVLVDFVSA